MSQTTKLVLGAALVATLLGITYYYWNMQQQKPSALGTMNQDVTTLPSGTDHTDAALDKDLNSIDQQLQAVNQDNASVNQGVSASAAQ